MRYIFWLAAWMVVAPALAHGQVSPEWAVVRIESHGASGCVIASGPGRTYILSCAHMLTDKSGRLSQAHLTRPIRMNGPRQPHAQPGIHRARFLRWDTQLDLSLIQLDNGPFWSIPIAPAGHPHPRQMWSLGYDSMKWPPTKKLVTLHSVGQSVTYTVEKPWHGRSGGGLYDPRGYLLGIVGGYEVRPGGRGFYTSHAAILRFLGAQQQQYKWTPIAPLPGGRSNPQLSSPLCPT